MKTRAQRGFSLVEMLVTVGILIWVFAIVFTYIRTGQQRYNVEQVKSDMVQESRQFMDQIARDLHMVGYPGRRMYGLTPAGAPLLPPANWFDDSRVSAGVVRLTPTSIQFEGDVDNDGRIDVVVYTLVPDFPTDAPVSCPCRLQRGVVQKQAAFGALAQPLPANFYQEAQGIINSNNTRVIGGFTTVGTGNNVANDVYFAAYRGEPIFRAYDDNGALVPLPLDITTPDPTGKPWAFRIRTIRATLNVLGVQPDPQTRIPPVITMSTTSKINNRLP